jgi:two-component system chemotaxis response regulator CheB
MCNGNGEAQKDIVVIGASAGGIDALKALVSDLPRDLPASLFVVQHTAPHSPGILPQILERAGPLPALHPKDYQAIEPGRIYVAPPDHHLLVDRAGYARVTRGPKENRSRPAIDPLFRSAAQAFGRRVIGVVMTGWLDDGTAGLWAVKERGGTAIVQNPEDAIAPDMPLNAIKHVEVDHCVRLNEIAPLLIRLTTAPAEEKAVPPVSTEMETEVKIAMAEHALESGILEWGEPSTFACPECHGVLSQLKEGSNLRFRCHTGHAYSTDSLLSELTETTEETLWSGIRSLQEGGLLLKTLASHLSEHQHSAAARAVLKRAHQALQRAELVRQAVIQHEKLSTGSFTDAAKVL